MSHWRERYPHEYKPESAPVSPARQEAGKPLAFYPDAVVDGLEDVIRKLQNEIWLLQAMRVPPSVSGGPVGADALPGARRGEWTGVLPSVEVSEREQIIAWLHQKASEHCGPGHMHGEIIASLAEELKSASLPSSVSGGEPGVSERLTIGAEKLDGLRECVEAFAANAAPLDAVIVGPARDALLILQCSQDTGTPVLVRAARPSPEGSDNEK